MSMDGAMNIMGIRHRVDFTHLPIVFPEFSIINELVCEHDDIGSERTVEIQLIDPDGKMIVGNKATVRMNSPGERIGQRMVFHGVRFEKLGRHDLNVYLDGQLVESSPLEVCLAMQQSS